MGQIQTIEELISFLLRRRWVIILVTLLGAVAAVVYAQYQPKTYQAAAVIQIEQARVAEAVLGAPQADGGGAAQVLQTIEQRLTTREALTEVIERHKLFADQPGLPLEKRLFALRTSLSFQAIEGAGGQEFGQSRNISAIIVTARNGVPETAAALANDFAQGILDQSTSGQRYRVDQSVAFFKVDAARLDAAISKIEDDMAAYKAEHADSLPSFAETRQDELGNLISDIRDTNQLIAALRGEEAQIKTKQTSREVDKRRLLEITAQIDVLETQIAASNAQRAKVDASLSQIAETTRVLDGFERQLSQLQDQYAQTSIKLTEAETAQRLTENQQAQRFSMLERAITPEFATGGGKKKIAIAGTLGSMIAGVVLAFLIDLSKPVVRTSVQMQRQLDLEPVVCIPEIGKPKGPIGSAMLRVIDDPDRAIFGLPRIVVYGFAAVVALIAMAATLG